MDSTMVQVGKDLSRMLKQRSGIEEVYTDAGYTGEVAARATE